MKIDQAEAQASLERAATHEFDAETVKLMVPFLRAVSRALVEILEKAEA